MAPVLDMVAQAVPERNGQFRCPMSRGGGGCQATFWDKAGMAKHLHECYSRVLLGKGPASAPPPGPRPGPASAPPQESPAPAPPTPGGGGSGRGGGGGGGRMESARENAYRTMHQESENSPWASTSSPAPAPHLPPGMGGGGGGGRRRGGGGEGRGEGGGGREEGDGETWREEQGDDLLDVLFQEEMQRERTGGGLSGSRLAALPAHVLSEQGAMVLEGESCRICLEGYREGQRTAGLRTCSHMFHAACVARWLSQHSDCPVCRRDV